ncbi:MAG: fused MFS/spermidine synthase [Verrucomicrobia bacterium]|nr:fused MFS/spermidine synthase [Verrucomicrobiota bacterium]
MLPFALSIFTGAFLLFQVQPLIGKYILPWFGGSPGVWTTCLLFFQTLLLGGYAYAHFSTKLLKPRSQAALHLGLLLLSLALLPITPNEAWKTHVSGDPTWQILLLLTLTIGLPYFVLSATGPLMQQWFSVTNPGISPYRLYALSNIGSLLALLSYPVFFEVRFSRHEQAVMWSVGLGVFVVLCGFCAYRVWQSTPASAPAPAPAPEGSAPGNPAADSAAPLWRDRLLWVALPALASVLLLAVTNKLCQEVAVIPFLWVLPLALYLLTFVICFDHARWYHRGIFSALLVVGIAWVSSLLDAGSDAPMKLQIAGYTGTLFIACMICHGELYQLKPAPRHLTSYFLFISAGGALGGLLVAVVAPAVFNEYRELQLGLIALAVVFALVCFRHRSRTLVLGAAAGALLLTVAHPALTSTYDGGHLSAEFAHYSAKHPGEFLVHLPSETVDFFQNHLGKIVTGLAAETEEFYKFHKWKIAIALVVFLACALDLRRRRLVAEWRLSLGAVVVLMAVGTGYVLVEQMRTKETTAVLRSSRNFYGTLKVFDYSPDNPEEHYRLLMHGATTHGLQFVSPDRAFMATSYYGPESGIGLAFAHLPQQANKRYAVVGLGTGSLAVYGKAGDYVRIYEINPAVEKLARDPFTYLAKSPAKLDVVMGDARLEMEHELANHQPQNLDLIALDAFSSDAIPVHLLTKEAFVTYLQHLRPDGVIAVHISNRYLDLQPVVERLAEEFGLRTACISNDNTENWYLYDTTWMLLTKNKAFLDKTEIYVATDEPKKNPRKAALWTDDNANLYSIMK